MCKTKFVISSIFGWPDSKVSKSLWDFVISNILLKALKVVFATFLLVCF